MRVCFSFAQLTHFISLLSASAREGDVVGEEALDALDDLLANVVDNFIAHLQTAEDVVRLVAESDEIAPKLDSVDHLESPDVLPLLLGLLLLRKPVALALEKLLVLVVHDGKLDVGEADILIDHVDGAEILDALAALALAALVRLRLALIAALAALSLAGVLGEAHALANNLEELVRHEHE